MLLQESHPAFKNLALFIPISSLEEHLEAKDQEGNPGSSEKWPLLTGVCMCGAAVLLIV